MQIPPEFSAFGECVSAEGQAFPVQMPPLSLQATHHSVYRCIYSRYIGMCTVHTIHMMSVLRNMPRKFTNYGTIPIRT